MESIKVLLIFIGICIGIYLYVRYLLIYTVIVGFVLLVIAWFAAGLALMVWGVSMDSVIGGIVTIVGLIVTASAALFVKEQSGG
jgi:hypothetical protein